MNSRRSFFKSLALLGAAAAGCPGLFIPKLEPVRWKVIAPPRGWFMAEYKYAFTMHDAKIEKVLLHVRDSAAEEWRPPTQQDVEEFKHDYRPLSPGQIVAVNGSWHWEKAEA